MHFSMRLLEIESNSLFIILVPRRIFTTIPFNNLADDDSVNDLTDVGQCRFQNLAQDTMIKTRLLNLLVALAVIGLAGMEVVIAAPSIDGIWEPIRGGGTGHPAPEDVRLTPEGQAEYDNFSEENDPALRCIVPGVPLGIYDPYPLEIIQQDHQIVFLHEHFHMVRRIFTDGRQAPEDWWPSLGGFSVGHWEEDTLVVKTTYLSPDNLMWHTGMPFSGDPETYVIERYTFSGDQFTYIAEVFDPRYYEEPYVLSGARELAPDGMIMEYECYSEYSGF